MQVPPVKIGVIISDDFDVAFFQKLYQFPVGFRFANVETDAEVRFHAPDDFGDDALCLAVLEIGVRLLSRRRDGGNDRVFFKIFLFIGRQEKRRTVLPGIFCVKLTADMRVEQHQLVDGLIDIFTDFGAVLPSGDGKRFCKQISVHRRFRAVIDGGVYEGVDLAVFVHGNDLEESFGGNEHKILIFVEAVRKKGRANILLRADERGISDTELLSGSQRFVRTDGDADRGIGNRVLRCREIGLGVVCVRQRGY